ncbi:MAG: GAF domain-containing SpoIIE family protein phosphatase [Fibrobacterota bacterium]
MENSCSPNEELRIQNELLKSQLMNASLINELTKVLHSCTDLESIIKTVLLAFQDLLYFERVILFSIDEKKFCLTPRAWVGFEAEEVEKISIPLGFEGGDITDAIFLNRHIIVEEPDENSDIFYNRLDSPSYLNIPLLNKPNKRCWEMKNCSKKACSCYGSINPFCWSQTGAGQLLNTRTEDERRRCCIGCKAFNAEGVFWMDRKNKRTPVSSDDITTLTAIINLAGLIIDNFRIMNALDSANQNLQNANEQLRVVNHDLNIAQSKIQSDLEHARTIQQGLLPQNIKSSEAFSISSRYLSADAVGGDYFDLFQISQDAYGVVVADVSGHGVASALIMSMAKVLLKTYSQKELSPQKTLECINKVFLSEIATEHFVTIFYAVFDTNQKILRFTSAGHCPTLFLDRETGDCTMLKADGLFLGVFPDMMLSERQYEYTPGKHRLILYTDGLTEANNLKNRMYGMENLITMAQKTAPLKAEDATEAILEDQKNFCGPVPAEDDITLLLLDL